jgi:3-oxoacyl-[acyl-carrier protein] reductase
MHNVIVTGASRGIGLAIASTLAAEGYCVIAIARTETEQFRSAIAGLAVLEAAQPGALHFRSFDFTEIRGIAGLVSSLREEFGPLYGLINNVGIGTASVLTMMRDQEIEQLARVNMLSPIVLTKYVLHSMMVERAGRIVNIASIVSSTGYTGLSAYAATKASLVGFTHSLAREVGQLGITVNAVAPGFADTEMTRELGEEERHKIARRSAMRRLIEPDDVAGAVAFLLSERAKNITGITLTVDAGSTA